ncbi:hypothetical protein PHLGIDRAFT_129001 [Phlebiopsis gigantea 11061_1 CR5-6]|uniref:Cyclopropane-fatty-acyl-phospholipid synthase n=1 Tax=Phlebiopsis gigantea (strain 11061_1 CR5-6) TaxID=745531 RepID=A0A0C3RVH1_PHLG1|nr:hypothetical protein PHLGIDRAFT_129001 [Phlebiopsis gigantea 11061_1 CR5-6]
MTAYATLALPSLSLFSRTCSSLVWTYFLQLARRTICATFERGIRRGSLELSDSTGFYLFGNKSSNMEGRHAKIIVKDDVFWVRVFLWYDIGFAESYMNQEFDSPDMKRLLNLYVDNLSHLGGLATSFYTLQSFVDVVARRFKHNLSTSIENVAGYDMSNEMYQAFLSAEMQYSCPIWGDAEGGVRGDLEGHRRTHDLEDAQARKIAHILRKARLRPGDRLLEIGSGWGSVAIAAARMGCTVDTLTLSVEQKSLAEERISAAGFSDQIAVHLLDYRSMPEEFKGAFDACVSVEMLEAVGSENMAQYVAIVDWALKLDRASAVLTSTTYPEGTYSPYQGNDFVRKYHWPNGVSPSATSLITEFFAVCKGRFSVDSVEDFGSHYPRCLREWHRRFEENWDLQIKPAVQSRYPELADEHKLEVFRRRWTYMYVYMDVAYSRAWLSCHTWTFVRPVGSYGSGM